MSAPADPIVITGVGMATPLGGAVQGAAAARAGIVRPSPLAGVAVFEEETADNAAPTGYAVRGVTDGFAGLGRLVRLCLSATKDLLRDVSTGAPLPQRTALLLGVPDAYIFRQIAERETRGNAEEREERRAGIQEEQRALGEALAAAIRTHAGLVFSADDGAVAYEGVGVVEALSSAGAMLNSGAADCCLVGAVDSYADPSRLAAAHSLRLLRTAEAPTGFMPGEAAAFLLLETESGAKRRGSAPRAVLGEAQVARDPIHRLSEETPVGRTLARVIEEANESILRAGQAAGSMIGSLNGDEWRAREWGSTLVHLPRSTAELPLSLPAASFGEVGTAFPLLAAVLATRAHLRGYARGTAVLVWASNDDGTKGAFHVDSVMNLRR